jgi:hypothetical protein
MEQSAAVYNELDLRELSRQASPVCAIDGNVYDITLAIESDPSLQGAFPDNMLPSNACPHMRLCAELVGCNLDELNGLVDDVEAKVEHVREQIKALNLHPLGNFVSLRDWEQHQASKTDFTKAKCPFASQSREAARCPFAHDRQPALRPMTLKANQLSCCCVRLSAHRDHDRCLVLVSMYFSNSACTTDRRLACLAWWLSTDWCLT